MNRETIIRETVDGVLKETIIKETNIKDSSSNEFSPFDNFQIEEYKNISNAHFESVKQISTFFRYYLLILAAPVFILNVVSAAQGGISNFLNGGDASLYYTIVSYYLIAVAIIGFFIFLYVINLRLDAVLYARAVNKVRKYFYQTSALDIKKYDQYLQLPTVSTKPKYFEMAFFVPMLFVFSILNCGLIYSALKIKSLKNVYFGNWIYPLNKISWLDFPISYSSIFFLTFLFIFLHIAGYVILVYFRNNHYLKSYAIGIDIDGVLNDQTKHFKFWLEKMTGKVLDIALLKEIPVSLNEQIGVSDFDEKVVFNTKEYWETLPAKDDAAKRVNDFQKRFGLKLQFFSYRDWPQYGAEENKIKDIIKGKECTPLEKNEITKITKKWLKQKGIDVIMPNNIFSSIYYRLRNPFLSRKKAMIEIGNPYISDTRFWNYFRKSILNRNRFQGANLKSFKFSIEDTPENAIKLSGLCEYVFMFDEPYNSDILKYDFPKNVIRVNSWNDIYRYLKSLS